MNRVFSLKPGDNIPGEMLGFYAASLKVDNPTSAWWHLPHENAFIAPYQIGAIIPVGGTEIADIRFEAPEGLTQTSEDAGGVATFTYDDRSLPSTPGILPGNPLSEGSRLTSVTLIGTLAIAVIALQKPVNNLIIMPTNFSIAQNQTLTFTLQVGSALLYRRTVGVRGGTGIAIGAPFVFNWVAPAGALLSIASDGPIGGGGWGFNVIY